MKVFKYLLIVIGFVLFFVGYFSNSNLFNIVNRNLYNSSDNSIPKNIINLDVINNENTDNITTLLLTNQLCIFYNKNEGIPVSDNLDILSIIGKAFYYNNLVNYSDLVTLKDIGISTIGKIQLRKEASVWLKYMTDNIETSKITYTISSGFRDMSLQEYIFDYKVSTLGEKNAMLYAAKPGFSEHHLGTTVDILTYENNLKLMPSYNKTKLAKWLTNNAYKYGFVQSYPEGTSDETGFTYEPWHYRYVGLKLANTIHNSKITLYEYLYSQYNYCIIDN